jgi:hypothetical protein
VELKKTCQGMLIPFLETLMSSGKNIFCAAFHVDKSDLANTWLIQLSTSVVHSAILFPPRPESGVNSKNSFGQIFYTRLENLKLFAGIFVFC